VFAGFQRRPARTLCLLRQIARNAQTGRTETGPSEQGISVGIGNSTTCRERKNPAGAARQGELAGWFWKQKSKRPSRTHGFFALTLDFRPAMQMAPARVT
jgi:hypothetical protein